MKKALIFYGGWEGHEPEPVARRLGRLLARDGVLCDVVRGTACLDDGEGLMGYDLIVPCLTCGELTGAQEKNVARAIAAGVGIAGCHGGMCDAFRNATEWQFITGGQWVSHPGGSGVRYTVNIRRGSSVITEGMADFEVVSEQYYLHVDPAVEVLATTRFPVAQGPHASNKPVDMPVAWTKYYGLGKVFYCSLGHHDELFDAAPEAQELMARGMRWAMR